MLYAVGVFLMLLPIAAIIAVMIYQEGLKESLVAIGITLAILLSTLVGGYLMFLADRG